MRTKRAPRRHDTSNLAGLRAGLYVRVSRADERDNYDGGQEKSTTDQLADGRAWAGRAGVAIADEYQDPDISASRFTGKARPEFERLCADIEAGRLDVVWFWELSRQQRRLSVFATFRDLCRDHGVLWVIRDRVADPADPKDMITAGVLSLIGENESEQISERVMRGKRSSAYDGRPAGRVPYGYRRVYDPATRAWVRDEPDTWDGDGRPIEDSPAYIVRECYDRLLAGESLTALRRDLNERGIRTGTGAQWYNSTVRAMVLSPTYAGLRVYRREDHDALTGAILADVEARWPALVEPDVFWRCYRLLTDPARRMTRPGRGAHLLSSIARCAVCGGKLIRRAASPTGSRADQYACSERVCVGIDQALLDAFVTDRLVAWLSDPDIAASLRASADSALARQARADADRARAELEEWRALAERGEVTPASFARAERGALDRIGEADRLADDAELPPVLAGKLGPQARAGWAALPVMVRRQIVSAVADITVHPVGRHSGGPAGKVHPVYRVGWTWKLGPDAGQHIAPMDWEAHRAALAAIREAQPRRDYVSAARREQITVAMLADPMASDREIARRAGRTDRHAIRRVRRELESAGRIPVIRRNRWQTVVDGVPQPRPPARRAAG